MFRKKYILVLAVLALGLIVSGCTDSTSTDDGNVSTVSENKDNPDVSVADETLNNEMVGVTDSEIQDLEAEMEEIENLINDMDQGEEISVEEI
ncbi:MAG: hypothetical protein AWU59_618 [Methanolobus sp. T82-4]|jgi:PBP1b-binding outer membrane lipoprotein LpoB|nr:MAG: hypothetical protein AWU59_618 [Methanolobus sp. T82-4]